METYSWLSFGNLHAHVTITTMKMLNYSCLIAKLCAALFHSVDGSLSGSSVHKIFQTRILEWVTISFSRGLPKSWIEPGSPALVSGFFTTEPPGKSQSHLGWMSNSLKEISLRENLCDTLSPHKCLNRTNTRKPKS